jgi:hypothetical protein
MHPYFCGPGQSSLNQLTLFLMPPYPKSHIRQLAQADFERVSSFSNGKPRVFYRCCHLATAGPQRGYHRELCFGRMSRWCSKSFFHVLVSFRDLLSRIRLGNRSRSTHEDSSRDSIASREISMTAPISPPTVDSMCFQHECRRKFSGHESLIHGRRTYGGIQSKAQRNQNRKSRLSPILRTRRCGSEIRLR